MPTYGYEGKKGDGKSYHVIRNEVLPACRAGRTVYTNLDLGPEHIRAMELYCNREPGTWKVIRVETREKWRELLYLEEGDKVGNSLRIEKGALIVIDEFQMVFDAREFKDTPRTFLNFMELERHFGFDVVWITQDFKRCDAAMRMLTNEFLQVKNMRMLSALLGSRYVVHHRQRPGDPIVATVTGKFDPNIFRFYRSHHQWGMRTHATASGMSWGYYIAAALALVFAASRIYRHGIITPPNVATAKAVKEPPKEQPEMRDALKTADGREVFARVPGPACRLEPRQGYARFTFRGKTDEIRKAWVEKVCDPPSVEKLPGRAPGLFGGPSPRGSS